MILFFLLHVFLNLLYVKNGESTFIVVFGDSKRKITSSVKGVLLFFFFFVFGWFVFL